MTSPARKAARSARLSPSAARCATAPPSSSGSPCRVSNAGRTSTCLRRWVSSSACRQDAGRSSAARRPALGRKSASSSRMSLERTRAMAWLRIVLYG